MEKVKMLEDLVGKTVNIWTINGSYKGVVSEVDGEWLKLSAQTKRLTEYILKTDMITSITVLY